MVVDPVPLVTPPLPFGCGGGRIIMSVNLVFPDVVFVVCVMVVVVIAAAATSVGILLVGE